MDEKAEQQQEAQNLLKGLHPQMKAWFQQASLTTAADAAKTSADANAGSDIDAGGAGAGAATTTATANATGAASAVEFAAYGAFPAFWQDLAVWPAYPLLKRAYFIHTEAQEAGVGADGAELTAAQAIAKATSALAAATAAGGSTGAAGAPKRKKRKFAAQASAVAVGDADAAVGDADADAGVAAAAAAPAAAASAATATTATTTDSTDRGGISSRGRSSARALRVSRWSPHLHGAPPSIPGLADPTAGMSGADVSRSACTVPPSVLVLTLLTPLAQLSPLAPLTPLTLLPPSVRALHCTVYPK